MVDDRTAFPVPEWIRTPAPLFEEAVTVVRELLLEGTDGLPAEERLELMRKPTPPLCEDTVLLIVVPVQPRLRLKPWLPFPVAVAPVIVAPWA